MLITISLAASGTSTASDFKPKNKASISCSIENEYEDAFITGCIGILTPQDSDSGGGTSATVNYTEIEEVFVLNIYYSRLMYAIYRYYSYLIL